MEADSCVCLSLPGCFLHSFTSQCKDVREAGTSGVTTHTPSTRAGWAWPSGLYFVLSKWEPFMPSQNCQEGCRHLTETEGRWHLIETAWVTASHPGSLEHTVQVMACSVPNSNTYFLLPKCREKALALPSLSDGQTKA